jgi:hypothetical protein
MKTIKLLALLIVFLLIGEQVSSQNINSGEKFGKTLNLGLGYDNHAMPVIHADYEFDILRNFTLAPFISIGSYASSTYWGGPKYPYRNYNYTQTIIPIGVKGTYYFDELLNAGSDWDFYASLSLGVRIVKNTWENNYYGDRNVNSSVSGLYSDIHIGTEYHVSSAFGVYADFSTGISMLGISLHMRK